MPIDAQMEGKRLRIDFFGTIAVADMWRLLDAIVAIETKRTPAPDRIADLTKAAGIEFNFSEMARITEMRMKSVVPNPIKTAIVVSQPVQFGFARMFQTSNQHPKVTIEIFHDRAAAEAWLEGGDPPDRDPVI
jgi:hypothetical protein